MKQKCWCLSPENFKPELFALITVFFPPSTSINDKLTLFLLRYWLNLPFLFFPLLLLSSWAFCGDAPARRSEPTLACDCAQEFKDCITACRERPQEWTEMTERDREGETERQQEWEMRMLIPDDAFSTFESVAEQRWRVSSGGDAWEVESSGGSEVTEVGDVDQGLQRQTHVFIKDGVRPPVMFAGCFPPLWNCGCEMPHIIVKWLTALKPTVWLCEVPQVFTLFKFTA